MLRQPKHGHMKELHASIKLCRKPLLSSKWTNFSLGHLQEAFVFERNSHECAAFLVNHDGRSNATTVHFKGLSYKLPPKSISILPDCKTVAFNTAQVSTQYGTRLATRRQKFDSIEQWKEYKEYIPSFDKSSFRANMLLEHMNTTKDSSDYLWYTFRFHQNSSNAHSVLTVNSLGHNLHAFVNGEFIGSAHGSHDNKSFTLQRSLPLKRGTNDVSLLSVMTGLPDGGAYLERRVAGLRRVTIQRQHELHDFTTYLWGYRVGLSGENIQLHRNDASVKAYWSRYASSSQPLTWYKTIFDAPVGNDPVALNLASMGKGEAWVNGQSIGRYWVSFLDSDGNPYQTWNHIPRSFLKPSGNLLVLLEEEKGNPLGISIGTMSTTKVCGHVSSSYPPPVISWQGENQINGNRKRNHGRRPRVQLRCPRGRKISSVLFSSFGTPSGDCETYATGSCHASNSRAIVEKACLGKERCSIPVSSKNFHGDPCPGIAKSLLVDAKCS
ncbi:BETA-GALACTOSIDASE RELATED [Salix purpurea]|nr:BETA-GALACTOSIDASE RELATED [Salix purpurea]